MLLSHSKGLLPASYGITVCIHTLVFRIVSREPAMPLEKIITCIRSRRIHPPPRRLRNYRPLRRIVSLNPSNFSFFLLFLTPFDSSYSKLFSPFFPRFFPTKIEPRPFPNICDERKRIKIKAFEELSIRLKRINRGYVEKWRDSMVIAKGKIYL